MKGLNYRIFLKKESEGGYTVTVPSFPGCVTYGETVDLAREMAREAIEVYMETLKAHGEDIPAEDNILEAVVIIETDA